MEFENISSNDTKHVFRFIEVESDKIFLSILGILAVAGCLGNITLCVVVIRKQTLRSSPTFILLTSLSLSDLLFLMTSPVFDLYYNSIGATPEGILCLIRVFCILLSAATTLYHLMVFSVFRYLFLIHPLFSYTHLTKRRVYMVLLLIWMCSLGGAGSALNISGHYVLNTTDGKTMAFCAVKPYSNAQYIMLLIAMGLPFAIMVIFHLAKVYKLRNKRHVPSSANRNRKTVSTTVVVSFLLIFGVCWSPLIIYNIVLIILDETQSFRIYAIAPWLNVLVYANSALDPFMYFFAKKCNLPNCWSDGTEINQGVKNYRIDEGETNEKRPEKNRCVAD